MSAARLSRRDALAAAAALAAARPAPAGAAPPARPRGGLQRAECGAPIRFNRPGHSVTGDTWACAWADDDEVYALIDDTAGFGRVLEPSRSRNLAIGSFGRSAPPRLEGRMVNGMEAFGYNAQLGADGACWKGNGLTSIGGVLYLSISRHWYHKKDYDHRQIARDASLIVSKDKGKTWSATPWNAEPLPGPLFPGPRFATPFFLDAGKDAGPPSPAPHVTDAYLYAVSTDGYWNNGNALHLARVRKADLPKLKLEDWEFFCGTRGASEAPIWRPGRPGLEACYPIVSRPFSFGQTGMNYLPALGRYLLVGWHYPRLDREKYGNHDLCVWEFYDAPTPWGPWRRFASKSWEPLGLYNPTFCSKFVSPDGRRLWAMTCGNFNTWNQPPESSLYTLYLVPVTVG